MRDWQKEFDERFPALLSDGPILTQDIKSFISELLEGKSEKPVFSIWKTIKLGTGLKTADDFRSVLKRDGFRVGDWANDLLGRPAFKAESEEREVDLVRVSVAELGFPNDATRADIYKRALEFGLELCPAEVGPQLRLRYSNQPMGEWLLIGMEPIADSDGDLKVFDVARHGDGIWLHGHCGHPVDFWSGDSQWVFTRRK